MPEYEIIRPRKRTFGEWLRSITLGPFNPKDPAIRRYFGSSGSSAGVYVDEDSSLSYAAVWNAVTLIAGDVAKVPLPLYQRVGDGKEPFRSHPLYELVHDQPNDEMSSFVFRRTLQGHVLVWGNAFAEIERDAANRPVNLWPLMPWAVTPYREGGRLRYRVIQPSGGTVEFDRADVLHLSGIGADGITGYPVIRKAMESIGLGVATQRFAAKFYENGATMGTVMTFPAGVTSNEQTRKETREAIEKRHGGVNNSHRMLVLYDGATVANLGIEPDKAQFLETRRFNVEEVARWFNIPVHKLKELARSTNNNIEHQGIEYTTDTLQPWFRMWEGELRLKLIPRLERKIQFFEHVTEALIRGDSAAQGELLGKQFSVGAASPNEIRGKFNMNPRPDGNDIYVPSNTMPADLARQYWEASIAELKAKADAAKNPPQPPAPPANDAEMKALREALDDARRCRQLAEDARDVALASHAADAAARQALEAELAEVRTTLIEASRLSAENSRKALRAEEERNEIATELETAKAQGWSYKEAAERAEQAAKDEAAKREDSEKVRDLAHADMDEACRQRDEARHALAVMEQERDSIKAAAEAREAELTAVMELAKQEAEATLYEARELAVLHENGYKDALACWDAERAKVAVLEAERDSIKAAAEKREAELSEALALATTTRDSISAELREANAWNGRLIERVAAIESEAETLKTDLARARADIATELEKQHELKTAMLTAQRHVFADVMGRMVRREVAKAKNYQATPQKLAAWLDSFYDKSEEDIFTEALLPAARLHLAWIGSKDDPAEFARSMAKEHFAESIRTLTNVIEAGPEGFGEMVQRTLGKWDTTRADKMADRLMEQEIRHGR